MNYCKITKCDSANGVDIGCVLWVSGCSHHCPQCHNPETWDNNAGHLFDEKTEVELLTMLGNGYIKRITYSGGDPLHTYNRKEITNLSKKIKSIYPNIKQWVYTGYTYDEIISNNSLLPVLAYTDVLVDGEFKIDLRDITLKWRGSSNQRVIDVQKSLKEGKVILYCE